MIWRYLRPSAERDLITRVESSGSGAMSRLRVRSSWATTDPSSCWTGSTVSTVPTRTPPIRTSFPGTSVFALGTVAEIR